VSAEAGGWQNQGVADLPHGKLSAVMQEVQWHVVAMGPIE